MHPDTIIIPDEASCQVISQLLRSIIALDGNGEWDTTPYFTLRPPREAPAHNFPFYSALTFRIKTGEDDEEIERGNAIERYRDAIARALVAQSQRTRPEAISAIQFIHHHIARALPLVTACEACEGYHEEFTLRAEQSVYGTAKIDFGTIDTEYNDTGDPYDETFQCPETGDDVTIDEHTFFLPLNAMKAFAETILPIFENDPGGPIAINPGCPLSTRRIILQREGAVRTPTHITAPHQQNMATTEIDKDELLIP